MRQADRRLHSPSEHCAPRQPPSIHQPTTARAGVCASVCKWWRHSLEGRAAVGVAKISKDGWVWPVCALPLPIRKHRAQVHVCLNCTKLRTLCIVLNTVSDRRPAWLGCRGAPAGSTRCCCLKRTHTSARGLATSRQAGGPPGKSEGMGAPEDRGALIFVSTYTRT